MYLSTQDTLPAYSDTTSYQVISGSVGAAGLIYDAYTPNTFYRDSEAYFNGTNGTSTNIRSILFGHNGGSYHFSWQVWAFLFDHAQTKADGYGLTLRFHRALNRVLVNP